MKSTPRKLSTQESLIASLSTDNELSPKKPSAFSPIKRSSTSLATDLSNARIIQSKLVYIINLPESAANEPTLRSEPYFGQYGKILKCVINKSPQHTAYQAYLTYQHDEESAVCIKACNKFVLDGFELTATFGTTKYCNYFLRGNPCTKSECLYLHEFAQQSNVLPRDSMPHTKHIQPCNSIIDGLKVVIYPPNGEKKLPVAVLVRERAQSEQIFVEPVWKSRFGFLVDGEEQEVPGVIKALRKFSSPKEEVAEIPIRSFDRIKQQLECDKWHSDILLFHLEPEKVLIYSRLVA